MSIDLHYALTGNSRYAMMGKTWMNEQNVRIFTGQGGLVQLVILKSCLKFPFDLSENM